MRQIGTIPNGEHAERFADFLRGQGMSCSLDSGDAGWTVWIQNEDHVAAAKQELQSFLADPGQERYRDARRLADEKLQEELDRRKTARRNQVSLRTQWDRPAGERCPLTISLLVGCAVVGFFTRLGGHFVMPGEHPRQFAPLISELMISPDGTWRAILSGEVWRIWSPMFLHFGWMHILFNGLWLKDFGMLLESRLGSLRFLVLVLLVGAASHLLQFELSGTGFGGMSGVNYGLFGYLWLRGKLDPQSGLGVSEQTVMWMTVWFVICFTGYVGPIANWAHAGGLAAGVGLGALAGLRKR